ncbi:hypothetical protein BCF11_0106 [Collimonas sp. PA-H2]|uniref:hypothetical protein n=1 Tax=Collimonas sp. PA-H2 TaxID=1881062 RepID=UPI000BF93E25|nr:hypothetical protein [Collimonas sp. PA-H2]PFH07768.1 hypothetical protein BCF11_0106 [Collimonas sp. PA-H2]
MKKIRVSILFVSAIFACVMTTRLAIPLTHEKKDAFFECNTKAIDRLITEQTRTGLEYSEQDWQAILAVNADACGERSTFGYPILPRYIYLPFSVSN